MGRVGLIMALISLVVVALASIVPVLGTVVIAPLASLILGAVAGWWASKALGYGTAGRGAAAGAIAGTGALIGSVVGVLLLASIFAGSNPQLDQDFQRALEEARQQDPNAEIPDMSLGALAGLGGGIAGFCFGLFDLFLATIGGLIAGAVTGRNAQPPPATAGASYPQMSQSVPSSSYAQGNQAATGATVHLHESEGGARIYPDDQQRQ